MKKIIVALLLSLVGSAFGQTFPVANLVVTNSFVATGLVTNADLANSYTTVSGQICALGGSCTLSTLPFLTVTGSFTATGLVTNSDLANPSVTVNGTTCTLGSSCSPPNISTITNVSSSLASTTGSIFSGTSSLTLASALDFKNGEGIVINHAGPSNTLGTPSGVTITPGGVTGSTSYGYQIEAVDSSGGYGAGTGRVTTSTGASALSCTGTNNAYVLVTWSAPSSGQAPAGYAVFGRSSGGGEVLLGFTNNTSFYDCGSAALTDPFWLPSVPQGTGNTDWLLTSITSGGGTSTVNLAANASTTVASAVVIHDDSAALQAAINALPSNGGVINLGQGSIPLVNGIAIGNGNSTTFSTTRGVLLTGSSPAQGALFWGGYGSQTGANLYWQGGPSASILSINGPLQGWGVQNLVFNCNNAAAFGMDVMSAQFGDSSNLTFSHCFYGLFSGTYPTIGGQGTDALHNYYRNVVINPPQNGYSVGIDISGASNSDTDYNHFDNVMFGAPETNYEIGMIVGQSDSNVFSDIQTGGSISAVTFFYSGSQGPSANVFFGIDPGANSSVFINNNGSPSGQATNYFYGTMGANGGTCPTLANLTCK